MFTRLVLSVPMRILIGEMRPAFGTGVGDGHSDERIPERLGPAQRFWRRRRARDPWHLHCCGPCPDGPGRPGCPADPHHPDPRISFFL